MIAFLSRTLGNNSNYLTSLVLVSWFRSERNPTVFESELDCSIDVLEIFQSINFKPVQQKAIRNPSSCDDNFKTVPHNALSESVGFSSRQKRCDGKTERTIHLLA